VLPLCASPVRPREAAASLPACSPGRISPAGVLARPHAPRQRARAAATCPPHARMAAASPRCMLWWLPPPFAPLRRPAELLKHPNAVFLPWRVDKAVGAWTARAIDAPHERVRRARAIGCRHPNLKAASAREMGACGAYGYNFPLFFPSQNNLNHAINRISLFLHFYTIYRLYFN
jgi:hypothetical protein